MPTERPGLRDRGETGDRLRRGDGGPGADHYLTARDFHRFLLKALSRSFAGHLIIGKWSTQLQQSKLQGDWVGSKNGGPSE